MPDIQIETLEKNLITAYAAYPAGQNGPGLLVAHEIFGLNDHVRALCDSYAAQGYITVCPDLFWREGPVSQTALSQEKDWDAAAKLYKNYDVEAGLRDLLSVLAFVRKMPGCSGKVGVVGSCLGGRLAFLLGARSDVDCSVCFYGVGIESHLDEVYDIRLPMQVHLAEADKLLPPPVQKRILAALSRNPAVKVFSYPNADHGFARAGGAKSNPEAAALANDRVQAFLKGVLR